MTERGKWSVVYKYPFKDTGHRQTPVGKVILVAQQNDEPLPTVWVEHLVGEEKMHQLIIQGTGRHFPCDPGNTEHVGSAICGEFVWHVYKVVIRG